MSKKDTTFHTVLVAIILCVVCSLIVSIPTVFLKPVQDINKALDKKRNILISAGLITRAEKNKETISKLYEHVEEVGIDLATGKIILAPLPTPKKNAHIIPQEKDSSHIKSRADIASVYLVKNETGSYFRVVFPIYGKGLWSTMYALIALDTDLSTVKGITFYEHGETPGLGGEIENPSWQQKWEDKRIYDENRNVALSLIKGTVDKNANDSKWKIDGLSGSTLTSNGVTGLLKYWFGADAFGPAMNSLAKIIGPTTPKTIEEKR